jgi:hypothetical protein
MRTHAAPHLSGDELDAILQGTVPEHAASHLETCSACRTLVAADRELVDAITRLPLLEPAPGFEQRVMARVSVGGAGAAAAVAAAPTVSERAVAARRRALWAALAGGGAVLAGFGWAAVHPAAASGLVSPILGQAGHTLWQGLQHSVALLNDQGWLSGLRQLIGTPVRALVLVAAAAGIYAAALGGLGRLLAEPTPDAGW